MHIRYQCWRFIINETNTPSIANKCVYIYRVHVIQTLQIITSTLAGILVVSQNSWNHKHYCILIQLLFQTSQNIFDAPRSLKSCLHIVASICFIALLEIIGCSSRLLDVFSPTPIPFFIPLLLVGTFHYPLVLASTSWDFSTDDDRVAIVTCLVVVSGCLYSWLSLFRFSFSTYVLWLTSARCSLDQPASSIRFSSISMTIRNLTHRNTVYIYIYMLLAICTLSTRNASGPPDKICSFHTKVMCNSIS